MRIELTVNNQPVVFNVEPHDMLLTALRKNGYKSVKKGCDTGSCGACTVLMDGKPIRSCSLFAAKAAGHEVLTVEGIEEQVKEFAEFLVAEGVVQCGYCIPGLTMGVMGMVKELTNPSDDEIVDYLTGNLCRCSGYVGQMRAIKKYLEAKS